MALSDLFPSYPGPTLPPLPPPQIPTVRDEPLPLDQQQALKGGPQLMNRLWHVAQMNQWYISEIKRENAAKIQTYLIAYEAWKYNAQLYASCRPPQPIPPPPPPPQLQDAVPLPPEHWFA